MPGLLILFATAYLLIVIVGTTVLVWRMTRPRRRTIGRALAVGCPTEPADLNLQGEQVTFNLSDHTTSPGFVIRGDQPDGPTAIVLHGFTDSRFGAIYRAELLKPWVAQTVVFDLPGHGDAQAKTATFGGREPDDVLAVVEGLDPAGMTEAGVVLFGVSMGSQIAIRTAALHPRFAGVVAVSPYRWWDEALRRELKRRGVPRWPFVMLAGWVLQLIWGRGFLKMDRTRDAAKLTSPLLVIHGSDDPLCPVEAGQAIADAAPKGKFVCIQNGEHRGLLATDGQTFRDALETFFKSLRSNAKTQRRQDAK
jgi:pimeloyl-ACP methyl ester carboxylesterase